MSDVKHGVEVYPHVVEKAQPLDVSRWQLSPWAKRIAAESCGSVFEYECQPHVDRETWAYGGRCRLIGTINMAGIDWRRTLTAVNAEQQPQPWCTDCNLPLDICRGHDNDSAKPPTIVHAIVVLWQQLDAMQECDLAAAMVRADEHAAEGFHMALGMALEAVRSPRYVGEDKERHARIWDSIEAQLRVAQ